MHEKILVPKYPFKPSCLSLLFSELPKMWTTHTYKTDIHFKGNINVNTRKY